MSDRSSWHALSLVEARARLASGVLTARGLADAVGLLVLTGQGS